MRPVTCHKVLTVYDLGQFGVNWYRYSCFNKTVDNYVNVSTCACGAVKIPVCLFVFLIDATRQRHDERKDGVVA